MKLLINLEVSLNGLFIPITNYADNAPVGAYSVSHMLSWVSVSIWWMVVVSVVYINADTTIFGVHTLVRRSAITTSNVTTLYMRVFGYNQIIGSIQMKLKECIERHYSSQKEYAERWGFTKAMVSRWIKKGCLVDGMHWPHPKLMKRDMSQNNKGE